MGLSVKPYACVLMVLEVLPTSVVKRGKCYIATSRSTLDNNYSGMYCCDNFEDINSTCIECKDGYSSQKGGSCQPCEKGWHGYKCTEQCRCKDNERCDHVKGCLTLTTTDDEGLRKDSTITSKRSHTITESFIAKNYTRNDHTELMKIQPILIYLICAGFVTILVTIASAIMIYRKKGTRMVVDEEQPQIENIETGHYLTVL